MLTKKDLLILTYLRENSRQSLTKISSETQIPVSTIFNILNKLEKTVVKKHVSLIDFQRMGFNVRVALALKTKKKSELISFLYQHPNINSISRITNGFDFFIDAVFQNLYDYELFKEEIERFDLTKIKEHHVIEELKREEMQLKF